jgi:glycosyltransferase involved in cell wall biosynthesis
MNYLCVIDNFFYDYPGGAARVAWDISAFMKQKGHSVTLLCRKQNDSDEEVSVHQGVRVIRYTPCRTFPLDPFKLKRHFRDIRRIVDQYVSKTTWDWAHYHLPVEGFLVHTQRPNARKYCYTMHSPVMLEQNINLSAQGLIGRLKSMGGFQLRHMESKVLHAVHKIHTLSNFTRQYIQNQYGLGDKVSVIPHWCREDFIRTRSRQEARKGLGWPDQADVIFTVRRLGPRIGLDIAIQAIAPLVRKKENLIFVIAGTGPWSDRLKELVRQLDISRNVWFLGRIDDDTLKRCYEAADLFLLPTRSLECFGLIVLESLSFGLPLISTDAAALPEIMKPILPDCVVPAGDIPALRMKLEAYLNRDLRFPSPSDLISHVHRFYSKEQVTRRFEEFFEL